MSAPLLVSGGVLLVLMAAGCAVVLRDLQREGRIADRIRAIHGQPSMVRSQAQPEVIRAAATQLIAKVGQLIMRSGLVPAHTLSDLENTLASSGLRGPQGVGVFIGAKIIAVLGMPAAAWLLAQHLSLPNSGHTILPIIGAVLGLLAPDWLVGKQRKRYLARLENGLPDALDMMVICTQAGLGLGPAVIRVAGEMQHAYREIAIEFGQTANELQVMTDSRVALANLGTRTGLESFKRLATTLIQTIQYGTPLTDALRMLSSELRQDILTKLEERAARLPVLLTMPMILFILPCVFLIAGGPAMIQVMRVFNH